MKKILIATALMALSAGTALAQSTTTIPTNQNAPSTSETSRPGNVDTSTTGSATGQSTGGEGSRYTPNTSKGEPAPRSSNSTETINQNPPSGRKGATGQ